MGTSTNHLRSSEAIFILQYLNDIVQGPSLVNVQLPNGLFVIGPIEATLGPLLRDLVRMACCLRGRGRFGARTGTYNPRLIRMARRGNSGLCDKCVNSRGW